MTMSNRSTNSVPARICSLPLVLAVRPSLRPVTWPVPPESQSEIVLQAIRCGKHLLCQKPLARTALEAEILVKAAESAPVKLAVNVSMRWAPAMRDVKLRVLAHGSVCIPQ